MHRSRKAPFQTCACSLSFSLSFSLSKMCSDLLVIVRAVGIVIIRALGWSLPLGEIRDDLQLAVGVAQRVARRLAAVALTVVAAEGILPRSSPTPRCSAWSRGSGTRSTRRTRWSRATLLVHVLLLRLRPPRLRPLLLCQRSQHCILPVVVVVWIVRLSVGLVTTIPLLGLRLRGGRRRARLLGDVRNVLLAPGCVTTTRQMRCLRVHAACVVNRSA